MTRTPDPGERPTLSDLADLVRTRRETMPGTDARRPGLSQRAAAATSGLSAVTWGNVEAGREVKPLTYGAVERVLGWPDGSIRTYLGGGATPAPLETVNPAGEIDRGPLLLDASHDELLAELRRRLMHLEPSLPMSDQRRALGASSGVTETVEDVEAYGGRAGLPLDEVEGEQDAAGGSIA